MSARPVVIGALWKGADHTTGVEFLLTRWSDGTFELATRDLMRGELSWGAPVALSAVPS